MKKTKLWDEGQPSPLTSRLFQVDPELAAFAWLGKHTDSAAHPLHRFSDDGQPYTSPGILVLRVQPLEQPEDPRVMLRSDSDSIVLNP